MNFGHSAEIDFEIFAYPYPGRSANTSRGLCFSSRREKKLIARVRPGVCETLAAFSPTSAFSRLDLPTFDRPRNAISGTAGAGNCAADKAESRNCVVNRMAGSRAPLRHSLKCRTEKSASLARIQDGAAGGGFRRNSGSIAANLK